MPGMPLFVFVSPLDEIAMIRSSCLVNAVVGPHTLPTDAFDPYSSFSRLDVPTSCMCL